MPNINERLESLKQSLNPGRLAVLDSLGVPANNAGRPSGLTAWTVLKIYDDGAPRPPGSRSVVSGGAGGGRTWVLPLPQDLSDIHSMQYETVEFGALAQFFNKFFVGKQTSADSEFGDAAAAGAAAATDVGVMQALGEEVLSNIGLQSALNFIRAKNRNTPNPNMENLFKTPNLRTFQFSWNLTPLNQKDSQNVKNFVSDVKKSMYPTHSSAGSAFNRLKYPAEFEVSFHSQGLNGTQNKIFSTSFAACTDFTVQYTPNGSFNTHTDGLPTTVSINATFQEIITLDKDQIGSL